MIAERAPATPRLRHKLAVSAFSIGIVVVAGGFDVTSRKSDRRAPESATRASSSASAADREAGIDCAIDPPTLTGIEQQIDAVMGRGSRGGWVAIVDRAGAVCSVTKIGAPIQAARAEAIAKAHTANSFSNGWWAISTAQLYVSSLPGGPLHGIAHWGIAPDLAGRAGSDAGAVDALSVTGGGVALYLRPAGTVEPKLHIVIGGLGVSGDTPCADHAVAYRIRAQAGLNAIPGGFSSRGDDNIDYLAAGEKPAGWKHPACDKESARP